MLFRQPRVLGVILDVSLQHRNEQRLIDQVKDDLIKHIRSFDEDDMFYLYHEEVVKVAEKRGEQVHAVANYKTDGYLFDLNYAMKQTLYVVAAEDEELEKAIVLVTDRMSSQAEQAIKKVCMLNERDYLNCKILVCNIGDNFEATFDYNLINDENLFQILQKEFPPDGDNKSELS